MSNNKSSSYIIDTDQSRLGMNLLFSPSNNQSEEGPKPYRKRNLPASFYQPPHVNNKSKNGDGQHTKNQLSLPDTSLCPRTDSNYIHSRAISDTAVLTGQYAMTSRSSDINSKTSVLPLPNGWREERTSDGQIFYADRLTKATTWIDPRPSHYAAFQSYCTTLPLPEGYEQRCDAGGNIYFIDHKSKKTCWDDPRLNYYRSLMTERFDIPSSTTSQPQEDLLTNKLIKISKERQALQLRTQELEKMEADIRKELNQHGNKNNQSLTDQTTIESLIDDLLLHKRQDSTDSGLGDGIHNTNRTFDAFSDFPDDFLFPGSSGISHNVPDFGGLPVDLNLPVQDPRSISIMNDSQLKNKSSKQPQQWPYNTHF